MTASDSAIRLHSPGLLYWLQRMAERLSTLSALAGMGVILLVMLYTVVDVALRYIFNAPLPGAVDVTGYGLGLAVAAAMPHSFASGAHVTVDVLTDMLPRRGRLLLAGFVGLGGTAALGLYAWRLWLYAGDKLSVGDRMWILDLETWPVWYAVAAGFSITVAVAALQSLGLLAAAVTGEDEA